MGRRFIRGRPGPAPGNVGDETMKRIVLAGLMVCVAHSAATAGGLPSIKRGEPYEAARKSLIARGRQPARPADQEDNCSSWDDRCKWPETVSCSGTGQGFCTFTWRRGDTLIQVGTKGERPRVYSVGPCRNRQCG